MADISRLSRLLDGVQRQVAISSNTLVVDNLKIKMGSGDDANHATFSGTLTAARSISMPDANVNLGDIALNSASRHDAVSLLAADDPTQQTLNLSGQELSVNLATVSTDGAMSAEDKAKLDGVEANATADQNASEVPVTPQNGVAASNVQAALEEVDAEAVAAQADATQALADAATAQTAINNHIAAATGAHAATAISYNNASSGLTATDVKAALDELKSTADSAAAGVIQKEPVRVASTANIDLVTGTLLNVDGISVADGDRVLVKDQTDPIENGIYVASTGAWSRSQDFDGTPSNEVQGGALVFVNEGTASGDVSYRLQGNGELTVGSAALNWLVYSRAESIQGGDGINKTGLSLSVDVSDIAGAGLQDDGSNNLRIADSAAGNGIQLAAGVLSLDFTAFDTDDLTEGTINLFYTEARFNASLATKSTDDLSEGASNFYYTEARFDSSLAGKSAVDLGYSNVSSGLAATDVQAAIDEVEGRVDTLEAQPTNAITDTFDAGESIPVGISVVRMAKAADAVTLGQIMLASNDAASSDDFYAIALTNQTVIVSAGNPVTVTKAGTLNAPSHGLTAGEPVFMDASGGVTQTAPTAANSAVVRLGIVRDANNIEVQIQVVGIN